MKAASISTLVGLSGTALACSPGSAPRRAAREAQPPAAVLRQILDPQPVPGPAVRVAGEIDVVAFRGCDTPPENQRATGEQLLNSRRHVAGSGYDQAQRHLVLARPTGSDDSRAVMTLLRAQYEREVLPLIPVWPIVRVERTPFTVTYMPTFTGLEAPVDVRGRRLRFEALDPHGTPRQIDAYYLNYDRAEAAGKRVVLVLAGPVGREGSGLGLDPRASYAAIVAGWIAAKGEPVLVLDEAAERWEDALAAIRMIDRAVLTSFQAVDVIGGSDPVFHLLASHDAPLKSAFIVGSFAPLWTRNDTAARAGGPFATDRHTDQPLVQSRFQWADFALLATEAGIRLGLVSNAGGSGIGKAGLLGEVLPQVRRFPAQASLVEVRGNDRDGDGRGDRGERCHDGEFADYVAFLRSARAAATPRQTPSPPAIPSGAPPPAR